MICFPAANVDLNEASGFHNGWSGVVLTLQEFRYGNENLDN